MNMIGRTLVILAAALVVVGLTFAAVRAGVVGGVGGEFRGERPGRPFEQVQSSATGGQPATQPQRGEFERRGPGREGGGIFGVVEVLKNALIIGVIVAVVSLFQRLTQRSQTGQPNRRPPAEPGELV